MDEYLRDAPAAASLSAIQNQVLTEIRKMLTTLRPRQVERASATIDARGDLEILIRHRERPDESLAVTVAEHEIIVSFWPDHLHFDEAPRGNWVEEAVLFIWNFVRGRVQVELTTVGRVPLKTRLFLIDDDGSRQLVETLLIVFPFNPFAPKRVERRVPTFLA